MAANVSPAVQEKLATLSTELQNSILARNERLDTVHDLIRVLEEIVEEG